MKNLESKAWFYFPFGALFLVFLWPVLVLQKSYLLGDYAVQHYPWAITTARALKSGLWPYWTDAMTHGFPLIAEGQNAAFYIYNYLAYKFIPFWAGYSWGMPVHMAIGGIGFFAYMRRLGFNAPGASAGALCFSFGSGFAGAFYNLGSLKSFCWMPVMLLLYERQKEKFKWRDFLAVALVGSQQWTAGFPQMALYAYLYYGLAAFLDWCACPRARSKRFALYLAALAAGIGLALSQLVPTMELAGHSVRWGESAAFSLWGSVHPAALSSLVYPEWGNLLRVSFYIGILPLTLVGCSVLIQGGKVVPYILLTIFFLACAFGKYNPMYAAFVEHLQLTQLRNPSKFLFLALVAMSVLTAAGFHGLTSANLSARIKKRCLLWAGVVCVFGLALPLAVNQGLERASSRQAEWSNRYVSQVLSEKLSSAKPRSHYADALEDFFKRLKEASRYPHPRTARAILLILASFGMVILLLKGGKRRNDFMGGAILLLTLDLALFGSAQGIGFRGNESAIRDEIPSRDLRQILNQVPSGALFAETAPSPSEEILPPNRNMIYGISHPGGYSPLLLRDHHELFGDWGWEDASLGRSGFNAELFKKAEGNFDLMGIEYLYDGKTLNRLEGGVPLLSGYFSSQVFSDGAERIRYMRSGDFDPRYEIILHDKSLLKEPQARLPFVPGDIIRQTPARIDARIRMPQSGIGHFRISAYPGWRLTVDGIPAEWQKANHAFMAFPLEAGEHRVSLEFRPGHRPLSLGLFFLTLCLAAVWFAATVLRTAGKRS